MPLTKDKIKSKKSRKKIVNRLLLVILILLLCLIGYILVLEPIARDIRCRINPDGTSATKEEHSRCFHKDGVYTSPDIYFY